MLVAETLASSPKPAYPPIALGGLAVWTVLFHEFLQQSIDDLSSIPRKSIIVKDSQSGWRHRGEFAK